jgi:cytochrome c biogenesis protein CcmG/thiol:disulfide interchange protein DsbE
MFFLFFSVGTFITQLYPLITIKLDHKKRIHTYSSVKLKPEQLNTLHPVQKLNDTQDHRINSVQKKILFLLFFFITITIASVWYVMRSTPNLASDFSLTDLNGNPFSLSDFKGKIVIIDFMATWCSPCRLQMPHYEVVWEEYQNRIVILSIDIDVRESEDTLRIFTQDYPFATWIWARDTANLGETYKVIWIPTTVIIDQEGSIRFTRVGVTSSSTLIQEIEELLNKVGIE